jgi:transposase
MSFKKRVKRGDKVYIYEVESYRDEGKVKQRYLGYLGVEKQTPEGPVFHPAHTELLERLILTENVHLGDVAVLYQLAQELKIAETIDNFSMKGGGLPAGLQLVLMSINHTINPVSLNQFASWYDDTALPKITNISSNKLNKDNLSSAMDGICREIKNKDQEVIRVVDQTLNICKNLMEIWQELYDISLDALYYDITSTYFEGSKCILAKLGYSRDKKIGKVQINIALVVTRNWAFPICFLVYSGSTNDQKTVKDILKVVRDEFKITNCTIIWDRGMVSKTNINRVDRSHQKVICGLKKSETEVKNILLSVHNEDILKSENLMRDMDDESEIYATELIKKLYGKRRKIVIYLNTDMQEEMLKKREFKLRSARIKLGKYKKKLEQGNYQELGPVVNHYKKCVNGVSKYFKPIYGKNEKITLDWIEKKDKVEEAKELDGKFAIMSTELDINCKEIVDAYFEKNDVERAFRFMKQVTKLQPTRCWIENRVRVHVFICYLAYLLSRVLEYKLRKGGMRITSEKALEELGKIKKGLLFDETTNNKIHKVATLSDIQKKILESLGLLGYINSES